MRLSPSEATGAANKCVSDSSDLFNFLEFTGTVGANISITVTSNFDVGMLNVRIPASGKVRVPYADVLRYIPLGQKATISIHAGLKHVRTFEITRSTEGVSPMPGKGQRAMLPLYHEIAKDLKDGKPLVVTVHIGLWDKSFRGVTQGFNYEDGGDPTSNLYWGARYGNYRMLAEDPTWEKVGVDVFKKTVLPNDFWKKLGVHKPFTVYVVLQLHVSAEIEQGYLSFAKDLFEEEGLQIKLSSGETIAAGGKSRVVGYAGHAFYSGADILKGGASKPKSQYKKGVFMSTCNSAQFFADPIAQENLYPMLFNTQFIAPEGYILQSLLAAVIKGADGNTILRSVRTGYQQYHPKERIPDGFFVNSTRGLIVYLNSYDGDEDGDNLPNRIDPEPVKPNKFSDIEGKYDIVVSDGRHLVISK